MIHAIRLGLIALYTIFWGTLACLAAPFPRSVVAIMWVARNWLSWINATCGIEVEATGFHDFDEDHPVVLMSNHQSLFDIAALIVTLPPVWRFVAKKELVRVPFFGWALGMADQIIIDRSDRRRSVESLQHAAQRIRAGRSVIIFPEGTRSDGRALAPFKSGGFHMAIEAQVPVVPVTVSGSQRVLGARSIRVNSGRIHIHYGEPIPTTGLGNDDRHALKERVRKAIEAGFDAELQAGDGAASATTGDPAGPRGNLG